MSLLHHKRFNTVAALLLRAATVAAQQPFDLDLSFRTTIERINVSSVALMSDGKILVSGRIGFTNNQLDQIMGSVRLLPDGSRDTQFPTFPLTTGGSKIVHWNDGYYVDNGLPRRLFSSGLIDPSFQHLNSTSYFSSVQGGDYHVYPDGSVVITGSHTMNVPDSGWVGSHHMIWFNNDGTLDFTRRPRRGNGTISLIVPQPDGKFLLSGAATTWEGVPKPNIFRVHADGTLDTSFTCAMGWGEAASMTVLEDGRILASGRFKTEFTSSDTLHFVRLMPDGALDPTFNNNIEVVRVPWMQAEYPGNTIIWGQNVRVGHTRLSDGRIVLWGVHMVVDGEERGSIAMLDVDGYLMDTPFGSGGCGRYYYEPYGYLYGDISGIIEAPDGSFYIWGGYKGYDDGTTNDPTQRFISRLYGLNVGVAEREQLHVEVFPNPSAGEIIVEVERSDGLEALEVRDALGRSVLQQRITGTRMVLDLSHQADGLYTVTLRSKAHPPVVRRVVIQR